MPRLEFSEQFADGLATVTSPREEANVIPVLDAIESFGDFGSPLIPDSIKRRHGDDVRKVVVRPFDLIYTHYSDEDLARVEAPDTFRPRRQGHAPPAYDTETRTTTMGSRMPWPQSPNDEPSEGTCTVPVHIWVCSVKL